MINCREAEAVGTRGRPAEDDAAKRFYIKFAEFIAYPADNRTLHLPIETVVATFG